MSLLQVAQPGSPPIAVQPSPVLTLHNKSYAMARSASFRLDSEDDDSTMVVPTHCPADGSCLGEESILDEVPRKTSSCSCKHRLWNHITNRLLVKSTKWCDDSTMDDSKTNSINEALTSCRKTCLSADVYFGGGFPLIPLVGEEERNGILVYRGVLV